MNSANLSTYSALAGMDLSAPGAWGERFSRNKPVSFTRNNQVARGIIKLDRV